MPEHKEEVLQLVPKVQMGQLINRFNLLHFQDQRFLVALRHREHDYQLTLRASPKPCSDSRVRADWCKDGPFPENLDNFYLENIIAPGPHRSVQFTPEQYFLHQGGITFELPPLAREITARSTTRYRCGRKNLKICLVQHSVCFFGELLDFSPASFRVRLHPSEDQNFYWINPDHPATLMMTEGERTFYSGKVRVTQRGEPTEQALVCIVEPTEWSTPRFRPKKYRARRETFRPAPDVIFEHPITARSCNLKVDTLSSLGFSVTEDPRSSVLMPGLLIPVARLSFANSLCLSFSAQVVHCRYTDDCMKVAGIALLDIRLEDHLKLISLIQQARDPRAYVSSQVEPEDLFEFFFETGFLYPNKYLEIAGNRENFRQAYHQLYRDGADIARHFIYRAHSRILAHFSTLRVYNKTWMNQHHAAHTDSHAGLKVIRAISEYINDSYFLNPTHLRYIIGYYRPENRFPEKYFGGFAKKMDNLRISSLDTFAYFKQAKQLPKDCDQLQGDWSLGRAQEMDIVDFCGFYEKHSGGLMTQALDLTLENYQSTRLAEDYAASGLRRKRYLYAVRHNKSLKALVEIQDSDAGLNLSELTNATVFYVLDPVAFYRQVFSFILEALAQKHAKQAHPVLVYPHEYAEDQGLECDKAYKLWILNLEFSSEYMAWMYRYCRGRNDQGAG